MCIPLTGYIRLVFVAQTNSVKAWNISAEQTSVCIQEESSENISFVLYPVPLLVWKYNRIWNQFHWQLCRTMQSPKPYCVGLKNCLLQQYIAIFISCKQACVLYRSASEVFCEVSCVLACTYLLVQASNLYLLLTSFSYILDVWDDSEMCGDLACSVHASLKLHKKLFSSAYLCPQSAAKAQNKLLTKYFY